MGYQELIECTFDILNITNFTTNDTKKNIALYV